MSVISLQFTMLLASSQVVKYGIYRVLQDKLPDYKIEFHLDKSTARTSTMKGRKLQNMIMNQGNRKNLVFISLKHY